MEANRQEIAEKLLGQIDWISSDRGFLKCPGESNHNGKTSKRDCRIIVSGAPTIFCFHTSCSDSVESANMHLRKAIGGQEFVKKEFTFEEIEDFKEKQRQKKLEFDLQLFAGMKKEDIFNNYEWSPADLWEESPERLVDCPKTDSKLFLNLFDDHDVLWNGDVDDSGWPINRFNFKTASEWRKSEIKGNFTCPSLFREGSYSRSNENVVKRKYLVVESDKLNQEKICAVFKFCSQFMKLRAVVYTGGKSLHGWFDFPSDAVFQVLKQILPSLDCDQALFKPSQPVRMPGVPRGTKIQSLLYLKL